MSSSEKAAVGQVEEETFDSKEVIAKQLEVILAKPIQLGQKLHEALGFFSVEGIYQIDSTLGYALGEMKEGRWGQTFAHLVRTNEERENEYTNPLTLTEAIGAVMADFTELLDLIIDSEEAIEKVWAAMNRAKDPEWKPEPEGEGAAEAE